MKTIRLMFLFFFVLSLMTNCNKKEDNIKPKFKLKTADNLDVNEYQIYSLILNEKFSACNNLVIEQETSYRVSFPIGNTYYETLKAENRNLDTTIFIDYVNKNDSAFNLENKFNSSTISFTMISSEEIKYFFNSQDLNKDWNEFYKKYPKSDGIIKFSRVGFNSDKSQAIVEIGHYYASLGADGFLIYLVKENNNWTIIKIINTWVS
jgi:hypothetical protein